LNAVFGIYKQIQRKIFGRPERHIATKQTYFVNFKIWNAPFILLLNLVAAATGWPSVCCKAAMLGDTIKGKLSVLQYGSMLPITNFKVCEF
jgi:hypothetical protein